MASPDHDGDPARRPAAPTPEVVRSEEELHLSTEHREVGRVSVSTRIETEHVEETVPRRHEEVSVERRPAATDDDGQVHSYSDGSISIPILEEELVITTRTVVRERVLVTKSTTTANEVVEADLQKQRVEVHGDESISDRMPSEEGS
jgi:uncharacterized protein (TIGR02271 family)